MRAVADTNIVVSGLPWHGPSRQILNTARHGALELFTTADLLAELEDVLMRPKFRARFEQAGVRPHDLIIGYAAVARLIQAAPIVPVIREDPDDDLVLACAVAANATIIVSGDRHLLNLKQFQGIEILKPADCIARVEA